MLGAAAILMVVAASCGSDSDDDSASSSPAAPASAPASAASTPAPTVAATSPATTPATEATGSTEATETSDDASEASGLTIALATTPLGDILVDQDGKTLYMFMKDTQGSGASTCGEGCVANWPPLTADAAPTAGDGLDDDDFTMITRDDGSTQVAYYGWPLYYFANDAAAGDTNGQGVGGVWWVVDAEGNPIGAG